MERRGLVRKGLTILFIVTMMLGVMLSAERMEVSAAETGTSEASITPSEPKIGDGTEDNPYQIGTADELYWFAALVNNGDNGACAVLTADITVNTGVLGENGELAKNGDELISWTPISKKQYSYSGIFDGQNHTISGLYFNNPKEEQEAGLFRRLKASGKIINVGIVDSYFNGEDYVGGVCGCNNGTIKNCYYSGTVNGSYRVGGICGENEKSIENCYHIGTVSGTRYVGSICGYNEADVKNCYYDNSTGVEKAIGEDTGTAKDVSGKSTKDMHSSDFCKLITYHSCRNITCSLCGGYQEATCNTDGTYEIGNASQLYWFADKVNNENSKYENANAVLTKDIVVNQNVLKSDGTLNNGGDFKEWIPIGRSYVDSNGNIISYPYAGVFDGQNHTISGVYYKSSDEDYGGGLFGEVEGNVRNIGILDSYFNGSTYMGGICGMNEGTIENCYNIGTVSGWGSVGGICGMNKGTIENCCNTGTVSGTNDNMGGICGDSYSSTIKNCYNTGAVSGLKYVGGVCGNSDRDTIANCYNIGKVAGSSNVGGVCGYYSGNTMSNCYYNNEVYDGTAIGKEEGKTTEEFQSGEVAYLLQKGQTEEVWGQTLTGGNKQDFPVLKGAKVYEVNKYAVCEDAQEKGTPTEEYSNSNEDIYEPHKDDGSVSGSVVYDNKCDYCDKSCHSFNEKGICEEEGCGYHQGVITNDTYSTTVAYCGDATDAQPKADDFTVASGTEPEFTWYQGKVTTGDLPDASLTTAPKEIGIYTLVVNAAGAQKDGTVYTAAELRVLVTIAIAQLEGTVTIDGTLRCNETVTVNATGITNKNPGAFSYKWYRVDEDRLSLINGETGASYTFTKEDIGKKIKVLVTSQYCNGTLEATTEATIKKIAAPMEGEGTAEEPYQLGTKEDLYWFANYVNSGNGEACAILTSDITVNTGVLDEDGNLASDTSAFEEWPLIGRLDSKIANSQFSGTFDGQGHTISGLYFDNDTVNFVGLFGFVTYDGKVANVGIKDSYLKGGDVAVGGVCGYNQDGIIENCYNIGSSVNGSRFVGGICGYNFSGTIDNCYNTGNVSGSSDNIGGICGYNASMEMDGYGNGKIKNCYNIGVVTGTEAVGSVCGYNAHNPMSQTESESTSRTPKIENCYYNIKVTGIGHNDGETVKVVGKTTEQFENGEVAYLLQEGQTEPVWGQTLTGDDKQDSPVLGGKKVYKVKRYLGCEDAPGDTIDGYSNLQDTIIYEPHKDDGSQGGTAYDNKCDFCGKELHEFNEDGSCKEEGCNYHKGTITNVSYSTKIVYCGDDTNAEPKEDDFTVDSGKIPTFIWYQGDVTTGDLSKESENILTNPPKEAGTYTLVVNAAGAEKEGVIYTAAELRVMVTIIKEKLAGKVTLGGVMRYNENLKVTTSVTNDKPGKFSYQWYRVDKDEKAKEIVNATNESYTLTTDDIGKKIKVVVSSAYCEGTLEATTDIFVDKLQGTATITSTSDQLSKDWDGKTIATPLFDTINDKGESNENVIFEYKKSTEKDYTQQAPTDAGTYDVRVRVEADATHHEAVSEPVTFTIAKVDATVETAPIAAENLTYDKDDMFTLINAEHASVTGGELQYALGEDGIYSTSLPTVTEAGTYSVYYKVVGDRNHKDTEPIKIDVTVSKAAPSYQVPIDISATCGDKLSTIQLPNGFEWTDEDVALEAGDTEIGTQVTKKAKYVPEDTKNYEEVEDIEITIQVTHNSELKDAAEPTCTEKGYSGDTYCKSCNKKIQSGTDIAALGHDFAKDYTVDTEATCISVGSKSRHCSRCEEKTEITEILKKEHIWDSGKITKEATETEEGVKTYSCKECGVTKTETVPKKDTVTTQPSKDTTMTQPSKEEATPQQPAEGLTVSQPPRNRDVITDNKTNAKYEVTDTVKKEVTYNAPVDGKAKDITIPDTITINGEIYKVMKIADNAFKGNKAVTTITIGRNVKSIGKNVFKGCKRLKTIIIKSKKLTPKTVSKKAFKGISKKVVIKVPKKKLVTYKKLLKKKGLSSKNRIKSY